MPEFGSAYNSSFPFMNNPFHKEDPLKLPHGDDLQFTPSMVSFLASAELRPIYTLVPYDGYILENKPALAVPFVPIAAEDLTFIDPHHLNGRSPVDRHGEAIPGNEESGFITALAVSFTVSGAKRLVFRDGFENANTSPLELLITFFH